MRLPRDLSGSALATRDGPEQHHATIPSHDPLKVGTLAAILADVADHLKIGREELLKRLFN